LVGAEVGEAGAEVVEDWSETRASVDDVSLGVDVVEVLGDLGGELDATDPVPRKLFSPLLLVVPALEIHMALAR
jgi:hypothetical protein